MTINDILPLKAARRDPIANLKSIGHRDTSDFISIVSLAIALESHLMQLTL